MLKKDLIGRCGLYCGTCKIYRAYKDSKNLQENLARKYKCLPEDIRCEGCQKLNNAGWDREKYWGKNCRIVKCLNQKSLNFCHECEEYDKCVKFDRFYRICKRLGIDLKNSLTKIKNGKIDEWMEQEEDRWKCPKCDKPISVDLKNCHWCGNRIRD